MKTNKIRSFLILNSIIFLFLLAFMFFAIANSEGYDFNNWFLDKLSFLLKLPTTLWEFSPIDNNLLNVLISTFITSVIYTFIAIYLFKFLKFLNNKLDSF